MAIELKQSELEWARNFINEETMQIVIADMEQRLLNNALSTSETTKKLEYLNDISAMRRLKSNLNQTLLEAADKSERASK
jgi:cell division protein FtsX